MGPWKITVECTALKNKYTKILVLCMEISEHSDDTSSFTWTAGLSEA